MRWIPHTTSTVGALVAALIFASGAGYLSAVALGTSSVDPAPTVTITIPGATQQLPPNAVQCPDGYAQGAVVFNHPGGHTTLWSCIQQ